MKIDSEGRQRIVADNRLTVGILDEDKRRGNPSARILAGLFPEITVKCFIAARKLLPVVRFPQGLDDPGGRLVLNGHCRDEADVLGSGPRLS